jgi:hypothetical protein
VINAAAVQDIEPRLAELGPHVGDRLRASRADLHTRLLAATRAAMRAQGRSLTGGQGRGLELGVETAVLEFVEAVADPARDLEPTRAVFRSLGRTEFLEGHRVDALRSTLTLGAREIWSFLVELGDGGRLSPAELYILAAALFGYVDALAGAATQGYLAEQRNASHDWAIARRRLITLLVQPDPAAATALRAAAEAARWPLPRALAVVSADGTDADQLARAAGGGTLGAVIDDVDRLVVPDPGTPGRLPRLRQALAGRRASIGPTVPLEQARRSYRMSARALELQRAGVLPDGLLNCDDHLLPLLTAWEPWLAERLAAQTLAPLDNLAETARQTLAETLLAWLRAQGQVIPAARELRAHPQTVRYRLRTLRGLFGATLDDPDARLRLYVALRHRAWARASRP